MSVIALLLGAVLLACGGGSTAAGAARAPAPDRAADDHPESLRHGLTSRHRPHRERGLPLLTASAKRNLLDRSGRYRVLDALWLHQQQGVRAIDARTATAGSAADVGDVAVIQDQGDVILPPNAFDLRGSGVRFTRNGGGGYDAQKIDGAFRTALGRQLTLGDDDSVQVNVPFAFNFYNAPRTTAFVNSDGNVTFDEDDSASTDRNVARLLTGPPRVSLFLSDLDPTAGGRIFVNAATDQYTVTWCSVRGFDSTRVVTAQATLLPSGAIEMKYGDVGIGESVVGRVAGPDR